MVPGLDKLKKGNLDKLDEEKLQESSYINYPSKKRGHRDLSFPSVYSRKLLKVIKNNMHERLQSFTTYNDLILYLDNLRQHNLVKYIDIENINFNKGTTLTGISVKVTIIFIDESEAEYSLSFK